MTQQRISFGWLSNISIFILQLISHNPCYLKMDGLGPGILLIMRQFITLVAIRSIIIVIGKNRGQYYFRIFYSIDLYFNRKYITLAPDVTGLKYLLRMNKNLTGDPCISISPRCDLKPKGNLPYYLICFQDPYAFGAIDVKITSSNLMNNATVWMILGPTT